MQYGPRGEAPAGVDARDRMAGRQQRRRHAVALARQHRLPVEMDGDLAPGAVSQSAKDGIVGH